MDYKFFFSGIKNMLLHTTKACEIIVTENKPVKTVRTSFLIPLLIVVSLAQIAGSLLFANTAFTPAYSVLTGLKSFVTLYVTVYAAALLFGEITFPLDLGKDFSISFRIIVYSLLPFFLCQILSNLFESLLFVNALGLFGFYILWIGIEKLLAPPQYKKMPLVIAATVVIILIYVISAVIMGFMIDKIYYAVLS